MKKTPPTALSGSYDFMHLFGQVCLGFMWARMAKVSRDALEAGTADEEFLPEQACHGALLHGSRTACDGHAFGPHPVWRRTGDDTGCSRVFFEAYGDGRLPFAKGNRALTAVDNEQEK